MSTPAADWDPLDPTVIKDPLAAQQELRERCPVAYSDRWGGFWSIARFEDVKAAARDTETFSSHAAPSIPPIDFGQEGLLAVPAQLDPPRAKTYRQLFAPYFTPKFVEAMADEHRELADRFLDPILERGHGELVAELSYPFPASVICRCVLRAPDEDWLYIKQQLDEVLRAAREEDREAMVAIGGEMDAYMTGLVEARRAAPLDPQTDFVSGMVTAEVDGAPLDDAMLSAIVRTVFLAGHETTANGLGSAILHLARHPDDQARLRADPAAIPTAIEELLRYYSPVQQLGRTSTREVELHGRTIPAGETVGLLWLSANHDSEQFPDADRCIIDRAPNRHMAFGFGAHHCLGAPLARVEMRIALEQLLRRTRHFELDGAVDWTPPPAFGPLTLPIRVET